MGVLKAVIFDLDGTLVDMFEAHLAAYSEAAKQLDLPPMPRDVFAKYYGQTGVEIIRQFLGKPLIDETVRKFANVKRDAFLSVGSRYIKALPAAVDLINALYIRNLPMAIGSSARKPEIEAALMKIGVLGKIKAIVSADDITHSKPHPEIFLKAAEKLGVPPKGCIVFEDSIHGVLAAKAAGIKCVAVATGPTSRKKLEKLKPYLVIDNMKELLPELDKFLKA